MINRINIIQRIKELDKEVGMTTESENNSSLKDTMRQILNKLISTSTGDINGKIIDLYNKMNSVYNDLASTSTSYTKGKIADLYTKMNNIYNELNSTSTSYMKGKINTIYTKINEPKELNIISPISLLQDNKLIYYLTKNIRISEFDDGKHLIHNNDYYYMFLTQYELDKLKTFNNIDFQMDPISIHDHREVWGEYMAYFDITYRLYVNSDYNIRIRVRTVESSEIGIYDQGHHQVTLRIYAYN